MKAHEIDYKLYGDDMQFVEVELDPGESVIAEAGTMMYMDSGVSFESKMGDGSEADSGLMGKLFSAGKRALTGESIFLTHFTNSGQGKKQVSFAAPFPGKIIPIDLDTVGGDLLCQKDSFLCAAMGTKVSIAFTKKLGSGFFGGEGFILQKLTGDGHVFIQAGGTIIERQLNNEKILVDTGCLVAFEDEISYDIERAGNLKSMFFGGEGLFLATLQGTGRVWLQSLPFSRLADRVISASNISSGRGSNQGEGGLGGAAIGGVIGSLLND
ncbi:MAG: TIGR00266 family protein [Anaerolineae bacterium]